ncbi:MAG: peptidylprolyl isomerase [Sphingomonadaceae bacterium]|nr:peptidylprolyl isomerase [Sphingomonadaceae bacterium]
MKKPVLFACATLLAALPLSAQEKEKKEFPAPGEIVAAAKTEEWVAIAPSDLLVMELAPLNAKPRRVVIQLMPPPFSQGWIGNIRKLAAAKWWDGTSVNRVQDNYVVQWGDATEKKALPEGLAVVPEGEYSARFALGLIPWQWVSGMRQPPVTVLSSRHGNLYLEAPNVGDPYGYAYSFAGDFPVSLSRTESLNGTERTITLDRIWPVHCYGMVGVGRNLSPDTGSGAELYTVIGHAPRHLDRNIALVGRVIEGIEHLSSLPRGTGALGFYEKEEERVPILSVRMGNDVKDAPAFEYLSTESASFAAYADARANRRDAFFIRPAGGADICNIPVPVRRKAR